MAWDTSPFPRNMTDASTGWSTQARYRISNRLIITSALIKYATAAGCIRPRVSPCLPLGGAVHPRDCFPLSVADPPLDGAYPYTTRSLGRLKKGEPVSNLIPDAISLVPNMQRSRVARALAADNGPGIIVTLRRRPVQLQAQASAPRTAYLLLREAVDRLSGVQRR